MSRPQVAMVCASIIVASSACIDRPVLAVHPDQTREELVEVEEVSRDIDFLFVVDNSYSMAREQQSLTGKFSHLVSKLAELPDGLPSVHIAVTSTDLGDGEFNVGCSPGGHDGAFLGAQCGLQGAFIRDIANEDGTRQTNYEMSLEETFACMANLGVEGCGFEQPLEAMRRALSSPQAQDFLREDAFLAVIIVSDEDDCSVFDTNMFGAPDSDIDSELGPAQSFRCFEFGVKCAGDNPRALGPRTDCRPRAESPYMPDVSEYVEFLYGLKKSPRQILVSGIVGALEPVNVEMRTASGGRPDYLALSYSCTEQDAEAVPPIRIKAFLDAFPAQNALASICEADLSSALEAIAELYVGQRTPCFAGALADSNLSTPEIEVDCVIVEQSIDGSERRLPECDNLEAPQQSGNLPCFTILADDECADTPSGLSPRAYYGEGFSVPPGTTVAIRCAVD